MDIPEIAERVINVHTILPYQYVTDSVFNEGKCGKRNKILFWKSQDRDDRTVATHFFIEFAKKTSVALAQQQAANYDGVTVHCLSRNLTMIPIFDSLVKGIDPPRKRTLAEANMPASLPERPRDPAGTSRSVMNSQAQLPAGPASNKKPRIYENNGAVLSSSPSVAAFRDQALQALPSHRQSLPPPLAPRDDMPPHKLPYKPAKQAWYQDPYPDHRRSQNEIDDHRFSRYRNRPNPSVSRSPPRRLPYDPDERTQNSYSSQAHKSDMNNRETRMRRQSNASIRSSASFDRGRTPGAPQPSPPQTPNTDISRATDVPSPGYNTALPDLDRIGEGDVKSVIDILTQSSVGPEGWMIVAATFRRKLLHHAALSVVGAMLEAMAKRGMDKPDLKPALLLMAQCHYSIAKEQGKMSGDDDQNAADKYFVTLLDWLRQTYGSNTPAVGAIARAQMQVGLNYPIAVSKPNPIGDRNPSSNDNATLPSSVPAPLSVVEVATARYKAVMDQVVQLRKEKAVAEQEAERARKAKDEAEAALKEEIAKRRSAEQDARDARTHERLALAREQREISARKDAEDRYSQERQAAQRLASEAKDDAARTVVQDLAKILTVASRSPVNTLDALRSFCEARARNERLPGVSP